MQKFNAIAQCTPTLGAGFVVGGGGGMDLPFQKTSVGKQRFQDILTLLTLCSVKAKHFLSGTCISPFFSVETNMYFIMITKCTIITIPSLYNLPRVVGTCM